MSNIIKYWGSKDEASEKIIDSNPKADAFLTEILKLRELEEKKKQMEALRLAGGSEFQELDLTKSPKSFDFFKEEKEARQKADEIIKEANETSDRILEQAILEAEKKEREILVSAREQGYKEGYDRARHEIDEKEKELLEERKQLQLNYENEVKALVPKFTDLVIKYVERLTGILADEYESVIYNVLALAIMNSEPSKSYLIYVPKEQYKYVLSKEDYIREVVGDHASFEIISDSSLSVNSCKIETENCVIDTSLDTRLLTLINSLRLLADTYK